MKENKVQHGSSKGLRVSVCVYCELIAKEMVPSTCDHCGSGYVMVTVR